MPIPAIQLYRPFSVAGALAAVLLTAFGRAPAQTQADPLERTVVVSVVNENGMNLRGLESNHFRGEFRRKPVDILSAEESPPHRVLLLYDISGSMTADRPVPRLTAERFLARMPPQVPMAFLSFASKVHDQIAFQTDRTEMLSRLRNLDSIDWDRVRPKGVGKTALFDSLSAAIQMFGNPQPGDAVVIISDGGENASHMTGGKIQAMAKASGIRVFSLVGTSPLVLSSRSPVETAGPTLLDEIGRATGGDIWFFDEDELHRFEAPPLHEALLQKHMAAVFATVETLVREMNGFYVLRILLPGPVEKPHGWKLEVVDPQTGRPDHHLILHYPSQLMPRPEKVP